MTSSSDDESEQQQQLTHGVFKAVHVGVTATVSKYASAIGLRIADEVQRYAHRTALSRTLNVTRTMMYSLFHKGAFSTLPPLIQKKKMFSDFDVHVKVNVQSFA